MPVKAAEDRPRSPWRGPARVAQCPHERRSGACGEALWTPVGDRRTGGHAASPATRWRRSEGPLRSMRCARWTMRSRIASPKGRIADHLMPAIHGDLAGDQQRPAIAAIVDDLEQIAALLGIERFRAPIVDDQQADALERGQQPRQPTFTARLGEIDEQARSALVEHREAVATGLVAEGTSEPRLADTGWADDDQMVMLAKPIAGGELLEQGAVETAMRTVIDVLDDGGLAQPGFPQTAGEALVLAAGCLAVDQQPEPVLAAEFAGVG